MKRDFRGLFMLPGDPGYRKARQVWNGAVDKQPAAIAFCTCPDDVLVALGYGRDAELPIAVRSGGHNIAGKSLADGGLVIDLSRMKGRTVDEQCLTIRAQAGLTLSEFDASTQRFGLATTMGVNGTTGIAGLTLGGGFGKLGRRFGLTCDNLISAEVVTADARRLCASHDENPDLFWGLRGGGGNFGIVTSFTYRLHAIGTEVLAGSLTFSESDARTAIRLFLDFAATAPDGLDLDGALHTANGERMFSLSIFHSGSHDEATRDVAQLLAHVGRLPARQQISRVPYLRVQSAGDATFPMGRRYFWKAQFVNDFPDTAIDVLLDCFRSAPSRDAMVVFQQVGGFIARVPVSETAYAARGASYDCFPVAIWDDPAADTGNAAWVRETWAALEPFSTGEVYVNNLGDEGQARVRAAYGPNYSRLEELKLRFDPDNVFSRNQNVRLFPLRPADGNSVYE